MRLREIKKVTQPNYHSPKRYFFFSIVNELVTPQDSNNCAKMNG